MAAADNRVSLLIYINGVLLLVMTIFIGWSKVMAKDYVTEQQYSSDQARIEKKIDKIDDKLDDQNEKLSNKIDRQNEKLSDKIDKILAREYQKSNFGTGAPNAQPNQNIMPPRVP
jgi:uncharacterized membrane-anchored protein YhcB (DUF1043 family)